MLLNLSGNVIDDLLNLSGSFITGVLPADKQGVKCVLCTAPSCRCLCAICSAICSVMYEY